MRDSLYLRIDDHSAASVDLTDYYGHGKIITRVFVPPKHRGKGWGSKVLKGIIALADEENITLWLEINSYGPIGPQELESWYERYGFEDMGGIYRRLPKGGDPT